MKKQKFYAYMLIGGPKGVADNWADCSKIVSGNAGAKYKSFESKDEAQRWLDAGAKYEIKHLALKDGLYFDAGTGGGKGVEISVTDKFGKKLVRKLLPEKVTNNYGELLACKNALEIALADNIKNIFGDSRLVIDFWSKGYIKKGAVAQETVELAEAVKKLRYKFESLGGKIELISGGANPADLGFHK